MPVSVTVSSAPSRVASVSVAGLVAVIAALTSTTAIVNVSSARSLLARLVSPSWAWIVTVTGAVFVVGVPHTVRAAQFGGPKERPAGRPLAE